MNNTQAEIDKKRRESRFLAELSSKTKEEKLQEFKDYTMAHPRLSKTFRNLWHSIAHPKPGSIILVYGPAGVGKTTLCNYLERIIREELHSELEEDREMVPLIKVEAISPPNGNFDWKEYFRETLLALSEPAVDQKIDMSKWQSSFQDYVTVANNPNTPLARLQRVVERALYHRRPKAVLIDEAQHLTTTSSGRKLLDQQNAIKSLANRTKTTHILFGSYDLLSLRNLNGQLARRSIDLHFGRYDQNDRSDVQTIKKILQNFEIFIPLEETVSFTDKWEFFYERSIGCIGIVKEWLNRAVSMALDQNVNELRIMHLEKTCLSVTKADRLFTEISDGEERLNEDRQHIKKLRERLGFEQIEGIESNDGIIQINDPYRNRNVGVRKPKRDKVGKEKRSA